MNTSLSDDEFDGLLADERLLEKGYVQRFASLPRWQGKPLKFKESFIFSTNFQIACLVANIVGLAIIAFTFTSLIPKLLHHPTNTQCGLRTDTLIDQSIGWHTITLESEQRFIDADPADFDDIHSESIWTDIYPGSWIWVDEPSKLGFGGGVKLVDYSEDPSEFEETTEGFAVAVMHQLHCVAEMKQALIQYRKDGATLISDEHLDHCVEYLRQAVMCNSDLTLERPENMTFPHGSTGWGDLHRCRDWNQVYQAIKKRTITRGEVGWTKRIWPETT